MGSFLSAALSLIVLAIVLLNWLDVPIAEKQSTKNEPRPIPQLVVKPAVQKPMPPQTIVLPAPPKVNVAIKAVPMKTLPRQEITKTVKALKPKSLRTKPKPQKHQKKVTIKRTSAAEIIRTVSKTKKIVEKGRTLLRLLEHGSGPSIEFAWPDSGQEKSRLYQLLVQCHGMRIALLDRHDRLFVSDSRLGEKWQINLDRYSTFMRQISGRSVTAEAQEINRIRQQQTGVASLIPMRIFTRQMDAFVLGGMGQIIGAGYRSRKTIRARYQLNGSKILVTDIVADGVRQKGRIQLACPRGRRL
tara:strand:- start:237 stop:1139 length:903 start_codon:yes stop_codon:yes gene_type:complete